MTNFTEGFDDLWIELSSALALDFGPGFVQRPGFFVGTFVGEGIEDIGNSDDAAFDGNVFLLLNLADSPFRPNVRDG